MGSPLRIYGGGAQVSLYDATNGVYHCGYTGEEIRVEEHLFQTGLSDSNKVKVSKAASFEIPLLQTDTTILDELESRRGILQEVYIVGLDSAFKFRDVHITPKLERDYKPGGIHKITLSGMRTIQAVAAAANLPETNYCQFIQNILGGFGAVLGAASFGTGWSYLGATSLSLDTSHLGGGYGNEQRFTLTDASDSIGIRVRFPLNQVAIKVTASAYVDNLKAGISYFDIGFRTKDSNGNVLFTKTEAKTLAEGADGRQSYTLEWIPAADVLYLEFIIIGSASGSCELGVDNVQLEIGSLTNYVENA